MSQDNPQTALADLVVGTTYADLPSDAIAKTKIFLLDSLGVALAGSSGPQAAAVTRTVAGWGTGKDARVWLSGAWLPAPHAAMVNAYLIHCMEFDCVHEGAVVHPLATILSAALAHAETHPVGGCELITALAIGVDIAASLGMAANGPLRFFRPATAGAFGATAAVAKLAGFNHPTTVSALGMVYGQISGTLQPHLEGSVLLPLQIGCNARAALNACDLAAAGLVGPQEAISGRYGYFALFENDEVDLEQIRVLSGSGAKPWRITELSHKPFPSGRLTHGVVDGLARLRAEHGFASRDVAKVVTRVPPLVRRLVGRPDVATPHAAYARLCLAFVAGVQLARGRVDVPDFQGDALADPEVHDYARRVEVVVDDSHDPNALVPQTVQVVLQDGRTLEIVLAQVLGHPAAPLSAAQNIEKFRRCCGYAAQPLEEANVDALITTVDALEDVDNVARLVDLMSGGP